MNWLYLLLTLLSILLISYENVNMAILLIAKHGVSLMNNEFLFECEIRAELEETLTREKSPFTFIAPDVTCNVSNWMSCDVLFPANPVDGQCGCEMKKGSPVTLYRFVFYRSKMTRTPGETYYYCKVGDDLEEKRLIEVIGFAETPGPVATAYVGNNLTLNWVFPLTFYSKVTFRLNKIVWKLHDTEIGQCMYEAGSLSECSVKSEGKFDIMTTPDENIPKLVYCYITKEATSAILSISMTFNDEEVHNFKVFDPFEPNSWTSTTDQVDVLITTSTTPSPVNIGLYVKPRMYVVTDSTRIDVLDDQEHISGVKTIQFSATLILLSWSVTL